MFFVSFRSRSRGLRQWVNENQRLAVIGSIVTVLLAIGIIYLFSAPGARSADGSRIRVWFYDLNKARLFKAGNDQLAPIPSPSARRSEAGVRARVFTCGDCNREQRFIGWIEKFTPEGKQKADMLGSDAPPDRRARLVGNEKLIAAPPDSPGDAVEWHGYNTPQAQRIRERARQRCDDGEATECLP